MWERESERDEVLISIFSFKENMLNVVISKQKIERYIHNKIDIFNINKFSLQMHSSMAGS